MVTSRSVRRLGVGAVLAVAVAGGVLIGTLAGDWTAEAQRTTQAAGLDAYLEQNLRGIAFGEAFPDIALWHADGVTAASLSSLLPNGEIIFYVSTACETCVDAVAILITAQATAGLRACRVVIVTDGDPGPMMRTLAERGVAADICWDQQRLLDIEHNVRTTRTWFVVDGQMILRAMGTIGFNSDDYIKSLQTD